MPGAKVSEPRISTAHTIPQIVWDCGWVLGAAVIILQALTYYLPAGENRDWGYYYGMAGLAAMSVGGSFISRFIPHRITALETIIPSLKIVATVYGIVGACYYLALPIGAPFIPAFLIAATITVLSLRSKSAALPKSFTYAVSIFALGFAIYGADLGFLWFSPFTQAFGQYDTAWSIQAAKTILCFVLTYGIICRTPRHFTRSPAITSIWVVLHGVAIFLFFTLLFEMTPFDYGDENTTYHWKAYLEPAAAVRAGGWLLWDVPSLYGYLQTYIIASIPAANIWHAFYLVNGTVNAVGAYLLFLMLWTRERSFINYIFSLLLTLSCTIFLAYTLNLTYMRIPCGGLIRFLWVYVISGYLLYLYHYFRIHQTLPRFMIHGGMAIWILGMLWAFESAVYTTLIWIPSYVLICLAMRLPSSATFKLWITQGLQSLVLPALYGIVCLGSIAILYGLRLGHAPDLELFTAYAAAFKKGFAALPILQLGPISYLLPIFLMMVLLLKTSLRNAPATITGNQLFAIALLYAALAALWAVTSYYIPRSHNLVSVVPAPFAVYAGAMVLFILPDLIVPPLLKNGFKVVHACLCSVVILGSSHILEYKNFYTNVYHILFNTPVIEADVTAHFPEDSKAVAHIAKKINSIALEPGTFGVQSLDASFNIGMHGFEPWLLPNTEMGFIQPLSSGLYKEIAMRRAERSCATYGFLVHKKDHALDRYPHLQDTINHYYREIYTMETDGWVLHQYQRISPPAC